MPAHPEDFRALAYTECERARGQRRVRREISASVDGVRVARQQTELRQDHFAQRRHGQHPA